MAREHLLLGESEETIHATEEKPLSKKEKRQNWWYYHKIHLLVGFVVVLIGGYFVYDMVTKVYPDYTIAVLSEDECGGDLLECVADELSDYGVDRNGDGQVVVSIANYALGSGDGNTDDAQTAQVAQAGMAKLAGDTTTFDSVIYISDPSCFERLKNESLYAYIDGTTPEEGATDYENMYVLWSDCKGLADANLTSTWYEGVSSDDLQKLFSDYHVSLRIIEGTHFADDQGKVDYYNDCMELLENIRTGTKTNQD